MLESITLLGSASGRNAGDAALPSGIMDSIDAACGTQLLYEIPTINPAFVRNTYHNRVKPISMLPWSLSVKMLGIPTYRSIMRTDLSLIFDAILFDRALFNPLFNHLSTLYFMLPHAKRHGKRVGLYNVGVGPLTTPLGKRMMREIAEICDFITVRDQGSWDILKEIGVRNPRMLLTADAALNVTSAPDAEVDRILRKTGLDNSKQILALNVSAYLDTWAGHGKQSMGREKFVKQYCEGINQALKEIDAQVLMIGTQHHDVPLSKEILERIEAPKKALLHNIEYTHFEIEGVLKRCALLFGMRLHAIILASANCTPVCSLPHQPKVRFYMQVLGLAQHNFDFSNFGSEQITAHLVRSWRERASIRDQLQLRVPQLKREASKGAELVAAMRRGEEIDAAIARLSNPVESIQAAL